MRGGVIAEAGVFQGEFAAVMNEAFPAKTLYLFDTFEGFDARDVVFEEQYRFSDAKVNHLNITSEDLVLSKMKYPKNVEIRKGYFPDTAVGINEQFVLVNLDMDLYKPTLEGLKFFYPKMVKGGVIIVHDFFSDGYAGVNQAVKEFVEENGDVFFKCFPIGDGVSLAIQK